MKSSKNESNTVMNINWQTYIVKVDDFCSLQVKLQNMNGVITVSKAEWHRQKEVSYISVNWYQTMTLKSQRILKLVYLKHRILWQRSIDIGEPKRRKIKIFLLRYRCVQDWRKLNGFTKTGQNARKKECFEKSLRAKR